MQEIQPPTGARRLAIQAAELLRLAWNGSGAFLAARGIGTSLNSRRLLDLQNAHAGQRAFVIGNGPSLTTADLDLLKDEITFASNKIYLAFEETDWRPTYFTSVDRVVLENISDQISALPLTKFMPNYAKRFVTPDDSTIFYNEIAINRSISGYAPIFSRNALTGLAGGYTVIYDGLQLAYYMGIREVYVIGCDHTWNVPAKQAEHSEYKNVLVADGGVNHFHPDYRPEGETWAIPRTDLQEIAFSEARNAYEAQDGNVYNATRGGRLEVFKRADLDEVLKETKSRES